MAMKLREVLEALDGLLNSVDLRVAVARARIPAEQQPPLPEWCIWSGVLRFSSRTVEDVERRHEQLREQFGESTSRSFAVRMFALPAAALPTAVVAGAIVPVLEGERISLGVSTGVAEGAAEVARHRRNILPWDDGPRPAYEYAYQSPSGLLSESQRYVESTQIDVEVGRTCGISMVQMMRAYFELMFGAGPGNGTIYYEAEVPARISRLVLRAGTHVDVEVTASPKVDGVRVFVHRLTPDGLGIIENRSVNLSTICASDVEHTWNGLTQLTSPSEDEQILECVLTHSDRGELDRLRDFVRLLLPHAEQNPLLTCLRRFRDLEVDIYQPVEHPELTEHSTLRRTPALAFQAGVSQLFILAGFETIDFGDRDQIRAPKTKFAQATADLIAYHREYHLLVIGACTTNVPRSEDFDRLVHVTALLRRDFPEDTRVVFVPTLFAAQHGEPIIRRDVEAYRVRLFTSDDLALLRTVIENGHERNLVAYLQGLTDELVPQPPH